MKPRLTLSIILPVALSIAAAVVPVENAAVQPQDELEPKADVNVASAPQARLQFCLDGWVSYQGNCYLVGHGASTWSEAENFCSHFESTLASVRDIWEYTFIQQILKNSGHQFGWIGGFYFENNWRWQDGSKFDYDKWEVLKVPHEFKCLQLNSDTNKGWTNTVCSDLFPFICKTRPGC